MPVPRGMGSLPADLSAIGWATAEASGEGRVPALEQEPRCAGPHRARPGDRRTEVLPLEGRPVLLVFSLSTLDRHILGEWLKILGLVLAATLGLLLMQALYGDFRDLLEVDAGPADFLAYFLVLMPSYLMVVLPLSLLVSLLYSLGRLHRQNEFTAMRSAGLSLFHLTRGIWAVGLICSGLMWVFNAHLVPWSTEEARRLRESLEFRHEASTVGASQAGLVTSVAFDNRTAGRLWFINRYNRFAGRAYGVTVSLLDARRRETVRYLAREADYDPRARTWTFRGGQELRFDAERGELVRPVPFAERTFADFNEDPQLMLIIDRKPTSLSSRQLRRIIEYYSAEGSPKISGYAVRYRSLQAGTLGCLIVIGIAIPFAVSGVRVSPAVGVSKSLGLFFIYYLLASLANALGDRELLTPAAAAWMPNLAMAALAVWLYGRLR